MVTQKVIAPRLWAPLAAVLAGACAQPLRPAAGGGAALALLPLIVSDAETRQSMSAEGTITATRNGIPLRGNLTVAARVGGLVRLDVETPDGSVVLAFASDGSRFTLVDLQNKRAVQGPAAGSGLAAIGLPGVQATELSSLLLARPPCPAGDARLADGELRFESCAGGPLVLRYGPRPPVSSKQVGGVFLTHIVRPGAFAALLRGHSVSGLARRIEVDAGESTLVATFSDTELNPALGDDLFTLTPPPGLAIEHVP